MKLNENILDSINNDMEGLMKKFEALGKFQYVSEGSKPRQLILNLLLETKRGFNYLQFMVDMCN